MPDLEVTVAADLKAFNDAMNAAGGSTAKFAAGAGQNLEKVGKSLDGLQKKSYTARFAVQNLGNTIRDIPFAAANPAILTTVLDHLVDSFANLKQETGSTKGALAALGQTLKGGGGILIGFNLLSLAATYLIPLLFQTSEATKKAKEETQKFKDSLDQAKSGAIANGLALQGLVNVAKDQTQSIKTRNEALKEANKILGEHGDKLTLVNIATKAVTDEINKFTQATIQQALAAKFSDRAADLVIKQTAASKEYGVELTKLNKLQKEIQTTTSATGEERVTAAGGKTASQLQKVIALANVYKTVTKELGSVTNDLSTSQLKAAQLFGELGTKAKDGSGKAVKEIETIAEVLAKIRHDILVLNKEEIIFNTDKAKEKIGVLGSGIKTFVDKFNLDPDNQIILKLKAEIDELIPDKLSTLGPELMKKVKPWEIPLTVTPPKLPIIPKKVVVAISKELDDLQQAIKDGLKNINVDALSALGESIGNAIGGGKDIFKGLFDSIFSSVGDQLKALGKFLISSAIEIKLAKDAFKKLLANPVAAIAVGVGLIVLGALIKSQIGKVAPGFAAGGYIRGPGSGTSDSILARVSHGEYIMRADVVNKFGKNFFDAINRGYTPPKFSSGGSVGNSSIGGGQNIAVTVYGKISGRDILITGQRAASTISRNG